MRWSVKQGGILKEPADVLVCSANPWLNLSGGVGGEILLRYGPRMLHLEFPPLAEVVVCLRDPGDVGVLSAALAPAIPWPIESPP